MNKGCGTIFLGAYREFYGNRFGKNPNCMSQRKRTRSLGCSCNPSPSMRSWTDSFGATDEAVVLSDTGGNDLLDSIENPVALTTSPQMCTQVYGVLYNETGDKKTYDNGCIKQDLMNEGYIYLDQPNLRAGSDLQIDQTRTATAPVTPTTRAIPTKVAFYSPWNNAGTIRNANTSPAATNPCGNPNYAYRQDNISPYDNSAIGDPYCWCDKSQSACDLNPKPAAQPKPSAAPLLALAALAFLTTQ